MPRTIRLTAALCATLALAPKSPKLETLHVFLRGPDGGALWQQDIAADELAPANLP